MNQEYTLCPETVDTVSQLFADSLKDTKTDRRDVLRLRLSVEETLIYWMEALGEGGELRFSTGVRLGRPFIRISVKGARTDRLSGEDDELHISERLLAESALNVNYSYHGGSNCLTVYPPRKPRLSQMAQLVIAITAAVLLGAAARFLPDAAAGVVSAVTTPLFNTILGVLRAISSPMIFLSVCWGIVCIGDITAIGKIGRHIIVRMICITFLSVGLFVLAVSTLFPVSFAAADGTLAGFSEIYRMILEIVPADIVTPFQNGNALQIIFLGICVGLALLVLGDKVSATRAIVEQVNSVVQFLMIMIGKFVPIFVFLSLFSLMQTDAGGEIGGIVKTLLLVAAGCLLLMAVYITALSLKYRISTVLLIKKLAPTYLIALTTASSAAAFAENVETCEKKLGIPAKIVNFAVPLGQVIFMPGAGFGFAAVAMCMAEKYSVAITPVWLFTVVIITSLLAMAAPPIPGGALTCYAIMFMQLGIPAEAIAIAVAINSVTDFIMTSTNLTCLQTELLFAVSQLGMLDKNTLKASSGKG